MNRRLSAVLPTFASFSAHGERAITADTALRLARYFGTSPDFWMNLQTHFDLEVTSRKEATRIEREVPRRERIAV